jgi:hypothetical protein
MRPPRVHLYDFDRTALDGTRVLCGRYTHDLKWVGRPDQTQAPLCARCYAVWREREEKGRKP